MATVNVAALSLVQNGVAFGCVGEDATSDGKREEQELQHAKFAREDVLVPRGTNDTRRPSGMGHWDSFTSTLLVGVEPTPTQNQIQLPRSGSAVVSTSSVSSATTNLGAVAIAGVILRDVPASRNYSVCIAVHLHDGDHEASQLQVGVAVRLDYLDGDRTLQSLSSVTANVVYPDFWAEGAASACT